jgi:DnaJ-class molecular chaperone
MRGRGFVRFQTARGAGAEAGAPVTIGGPGGRLLKFVVKKLTGIDLPEKGKDRRGTLKVNARLAGEGGEAPYVLREETKQRKLMVKVPAGSVDGRVLKLNGMGWPGKAGGSPGDLYLKIQVDVGLFRRVLAWLKRIFAGKPDDTRLQPPA